MTDNKHQMEGNLFKVMAPDIVKKDNDNDLSSFLVANRIMISITYPFLCVINQSIVVHIEQTFIKCNDCFQSWYKINSFAMALRSVCVWAEKRKLNFDHIHIVTK